MPPFTIKQNDTRPQYIAGLVVNPEDASPTPIDLTDATAVKFIMRKKDGGDIEAQVNAAMTIEDAVNGIVSYTWDAADTELNGLFDVEFEITWDDGGVETVPNKSYKEVEIKDDLG